MSFLLQEEQQEHCTDTMCVFLPIGYMLMTVDIFFDLQWCLFPSFKSAADLRWYYTNLLTPRILSLRPYPGYWFPFYAIYVFLFQCLNMYNWITFLCFVPIGYRYIGILRETDKTLNHWWIVVLMRVGLTVSTHYNLAYRGCFWSEYGQHAAVIVDGLLPSTVLSGGGVMTVGL
jgi:hypothetical protein